MKKLVKKLLYPWSYYLKSRAGREFLWLYLTHWNTSRYKKINSVRCFDYNIDVPDFLSFIWQFKDIFVDEIYKFSSQHSLPIIYDCGANIGVSTLYFKKLYPNASIIAFEADPLIAEILKLNLSRNGLNDIQVINKAVWVDSKGIEFGREGADGGSIYFDKNKQVVDSVRLKDYLEKEKYIDLLKMDIEGGEYDVLIDCQDSLSHVDNIFIEYHSWSKKDQKLSEILGVLEKNDFRYYIDNIKKRIHPFINKGLGSDMDLQLNIWGVRRI